jgi:hypothetical protein
MSILFLDVDGVLNDHAFDPEVMCGLIYCEKVRLLNHILRETGANVVLSSAWRYIVYRGECNLMGMEWLFRSHGMLANRLIGITREDTVLIRGKFDGNQHWPADGERGQQIKDWLSENRPPRPPQHTYVVIDDLDLGISACGHPFVQTDGKIGLTEADADKAIALLKGLSE